MKMFTLIKSDYNKYKKYGAGFFAIVFFTQGFWAILQYRVASAIRNKVKIQPFRILLTALMQLWKKAIEITTGISIPSTSQIGHSFYIGHFGGIIINANAIIGNNCNISQGVTIGVSGKGERRGVPVIGNDVYIGANAVIAGKIVVGDNVLVAACSLVNRDVATNSVVVGVPATVTSQNGSQGYI